MNITVVFDAIAGDMTGTMMKLMPVKSTTIVYGGLSGETSVQDTIVLIYTRRCKCW